MIVSERTLLYNDWYMRRGSSVVEQKTENLRVGSPILPLGTKQSVRIVRRLRGL